MDIIVYVPPGLEHEPSLLVRAFKRLHPEHEVSSCAFVEEARSAIARAKGEHVHFLMGGSVTHGYFVVRNDKIWELLCAEQKVARPIIMFDYLRHGHDQHTKERVRELEATNVPPNMQSHVVFRHVDSYEQLASDVLVTFVRQEQHE